MLDLILLLASINKLPDVELERPLPMICDELLVDILFVPILIVLFPNEYAKYPTLTQLDPSLVALDPTHVDKDDVLRTAASLPIAVLPIPVPINDCVPTAVELSALTDAAAPMQTPPFVVVELASRPMTIELSVVVVVAELPMITLLLSVRRARNVGSDDVAIDCGSDNVIDPGPFVTTT